LIQTLQVCTSIRSIGAEQETYVQKEISQESIGEGGRKIISKA